MKKRLLTLSLLSSVLNCPPSLAHDVMSAQVGITDQTNSATMNFHGQFKVQILDDYTMAAGIENAVNQIVLWNIQQEKIDESRANNLESALSALKIKIEELDEQYPDSSLEVKSEILAAFLKSKVVQIEDDYNLGLNETIIETLKDRGIIQQIYSKRGTICF